MDVTIVKSGNGKILVEWLVDGVPHRGVVPSEVVIENKINDELLPLAIPYGVDWAFVLEGAMNTLTPTDIANALWKHGVWTLQDLQRNPQVVRGALLSAYGVDYQLLLKLADQFMKDGG